MGQGGQRHKTHLKGKGKGKPVERANLIPAEPPHTHTKYAQPIFLFFPPFSCFQSSPLLSLFADVSEAPARERVRPREEQTQHMREREREERERERAKEARGGLKVRKRKPERRKKRRPSAQTRGGAWLPARKKKYSQEILTMAKKTARMLPV